VTAYIKPHKLDEVKNALREADVLGLTISEVQGHGRQGGRTETFRGTEYTVDFLPKLRVEVLCTKDDLEHIIEVLATAARTGKIGDGKIWAIDLERVLRIRTGETGDDAV
jgi:nitrogen regulatory protein PII